MATKDRDGDYDEQPAPYLQDAKIGLGGYQQARDDDGSLNDRLIAEMRAWGATGGGK